MKTEANEFITEWRMATITEALYRLTGEYMNGSRIDANVNLFVDWSLEAIPSK